MLEGRGTGFSFCDLVDIQMLPHALRAPTLLLYKSKDAGVLRISILKVGGKLCVLESLLAILMISQVWPHNLSH